MPGRSRSSSSSLPRIPIFPVLLFPLLVRWWWWWCSSRVDVDDDTILDEKAEQEQETM